jgi:streptogramin lyase
LLGDHPRPYAIFDDDHHFVWLSVLTANALVCFDMLPLPHAHANARPMMGRPAEVWRSESDIDHLVRYRSAAIRERIGRQRRALAR